MKDVGGIQYTVVADTEQLLKAEQDTNKSVDKMDKTLQGLGKSSKNVDKVTDSVKDLGKEADKGSKSLSSLQKSMLGALTVGTALTIGRMADDYRAMSERVLGATESIEEFNLVQERLLVSANKTFRPLAEAQELFISTSGNIRDYGYSLEEALDITDSMSYGFVRNAASADKAQSAIRAYDASLSTGKVNAMQWLSISGAIDTLAVDMAKQMGITAREVDKLGFSGQITAQMLNDALLDSFEANKQGADAMANTIEDAFVAMKNNLSTFIGEANKATGATDIVAKSIIFLSENISTLAILLGSVGAGAAAKYIASMGAVAVAKAKNILATRATIVEEVRLAQANLEAARAEVARTAAMTGKAKGHAASSKAIEAERLAVVRLDQAQKASLITTRSFMTLLGGPAGIIGILAAGASAFYMFSQSADDSKVKIENLKRPVSELTDELKEMTKAQQDAFLIKYGEEQKQAIKDLGDEYDKLGKIIFDSLELQRGVNFELNKSWADLTNEISSRLAEAKRNGEDMASFISRLADQYKIPQDVIDSWIKQNGAIADANAVVQEATKNYEILKGTISQAADELKGMTKAAREQAALDEALTTTLDSLNDGLKKQFNTMKDGGSALKAYNRQVDEAISKGGELTEEQKIQVEENRKLAAAIDAEREARKTSNKEMNQSAQVLKDLQNELHLATLSGKELAIARAEQRLNDFATDKDVEDVRRLAAALYDLNQVRKFGETDKEQDEYFTKSGDKLSGGGFDDQVAKYEQELELELERYARLQEEFVLFRDQKLRTEEEYNDLEYEMNKSHADRMRRIESAKNSALLGAYGDLFGSMSDIMKTAQGEQNSIYKAMFIASKGFSLAQAIMKISEAQAQALADPSAVTLSMKLANYAMVASTGAGLISSIQGMSFGGGRQYGGAVNAENYYRVNEGGAPEIFQDSRGHQYMMPNTRGQVISNKDATAMQQASNNVTINLIENAQRGGEYEQEFDGASQIITLFVADIRDGGEMSQALESSYSLARTGE